MFSTHNQLGTFREMGKFPAASRSFGTALNGDKMKVPSVTVKKQKTKIYQMQASQ